jgi:uncharacterized membrane protein YdjX (TVP38/TMEM64 family)
VLDSLRSGGRVTPVADVAAVARDVLAVRDLQNLLIVAAVALVVPVLLFPASALSILPGTCASRRLRPHP